jgi:iron complex transport system ATP-binding protein
VSLVARGIVFSHGDRKVLDGVDIAIAPGEVVALLGTNGAGKSTLLRVLLGLLSPDEGVVTLDERPVGQWRRRALARRVAYVPQTHAAHFPYTVMQMVALGRIPHAGLGRRLSLPDAQAISRSLERLHIAHLGERIYSELSGGERQRVLLARALAQEASILVMDEPLTGLDFGHQLRMLELIRQLATEGYAVLHSTHRPDDAVQGSTRAVLLQGGRVIADGVPRDVIHGDSMASFYGVQLDHVDIDQQRFFRHLPHRQADEKSS